MKKRGHFSTHGRAMDLKIVLADKIKVIRSKNHTNEVTKCASGSPVNVKKNPTLLISMKKKKTSPLITIFHRVMKRFLRYNFFLRETALIFRRVNSIIASCLEVIGCSFDTIILAPTDIRW